MRTLPLALLLLLPTLALSQTTAPSTRPYITGKLGQPIQLFNGHDLQNWTWFTPPKPPATTATLADVWTVTPDGILHDKGVPIGYIKTTADYENFFLTVEERHVNKGNGGVLFAMTGPDKIWPHCLEAQTQNGEEGDLRGIANFHLAMDPARTEPKRLRRIGPDPEKPVGQWETIQVAVDHGTITLFINGLFQNQATYTENMSGKIGLQAEGGEMEFRKIELTPVEAASN